MSFMPKEAIKPALIVFLVAITQGAIMSFLPLFTRQQHINNPGLFFTVMGIATLVIRPVIGRIVDRFGQRGYHLVVITGIPAIIAAVWILALTKAPWYLVLCGALYGFGSGMLLTCMLALCISLYPGSRRGAANAIYGTALDTGIAVGSAMWGLVAVAVGYSAMFRLTIIPVALALFIYFVRKPATAKNSQIR